MVFYWTLCLTEIWFVGVIFEYFSAKWRQLPTDLEDVLGMVAALSYN